MADETARGRPLDTPPAHDSSALVLRFDPVGRATRRLVFSRRVRDIEDGTADADTGDEDGGDIDGPEVTPKWLRSEQVRAHDGTWREVGSELVASVTVEQPQDQD